MPLCLCGLSAPAVCPLPSAACPLSLPGAGGGGCPLFEVANGFAAGDVLGLIGLGGVDGCAGAVADVEAVQHVLPVGKVFDRDERLADLLAIGVMPREADAELAHQQSGAILAVQRGAQVKVLQEHLP